MLIKQEEFHAPQVLSFYVRACDFDNFPCGGARANNQSHNWRRYSSPARISAGWLDESAYKPHTEHSLNHRAYNYQSVPDRHAAADLR